MTSKSIKDWRQEDRPREKMLARGASALTDAELLAILLRTGSSSTSAVDLARDLLEGACNSMQDLSNYSFEKMMSAKGIGIAKAATLIAAFEAGRRSMTGGSDRSRIIYNARSALDLMAPILNNLRHEECWTIFLGRGNRVIAKEKLSSGGTCSTAVDVKMIVKRAVEHLASGIILIHNHPGGNPAPSEADMRQTSALRKAAGVLDVSLLDHIIVAGDKFFSFCEEDYRRR